MPVLTEVSDEKIDTYLKNIILKSSQESLSSLDKENITHIIVLKMINLTHEFFGNDDFKKSRLEHVHMVDEMIGDRSLTQTDVLLMSTAVSKELFKTYLETNSKLKKASDFDTKITRSDNFPYTLVAVRGMQKLKDEDFKEVVESFRKDYSNAYKKYVLKLQVGISAKIKEFSVPELDEMQQEMKTMKKELGDKLFDQFIDTALEEVIQNEKGKMISTFHEELNKSLLERAENGFYPAGNKDYEGFEKFGNDEPYEGVPTFK